MNELNDNKSPVTLTVYLYVDENEHPDKWNIAERFDDTNVVAWKWQNGHRKV